MKHSGMHPTAPPMIAASVEQSRVRFRLSAPSPVGRGRPGAAWRRFLASAALLIAAGCGRGGAGPGGGPGSEAPDVEATPVPHVMLILPVTDGEELVVFREVLQEPTPELGDYIYREGIVRQGMPATQQAEVIRESLDKGASALIVFTSEPEAVGPALAETREAGTPVVVIGREVPVEGDPLPLLAFPPPDETAQRLFASLASGAGSTASAEGPRAVILTRASQGWRLDPLAEVLEGAAAEAGVTVAQVLPYEKTVESARVSLADAIREDPAIDLILFDDATGAEAAALIAEDPELNPEQRLRFGGFVADLAPGLLERLGDGAVVADRQVSEGARRAVALVLEMLDGGEVPDRVEIETVVVGPSSSNEAEPSDSEAP